MWALVHESAGATPDTVADEREAVREHIRKILKRLPRAKGSNDNRS